MTEQFIRAVAERFGLAVYKRVTTGSANRHFATFELTGLRCKDAWPAIQEESRGPDFDRLTTTDVNDHPHHGELFIELTSVWCE